MPTKKKSKKKAPKVDVYADLPVEERAAKSLEHKEVGNKAFAAKDYATAATAFSTAIALDDTNQAFFSNRSACYVKLGKNSAALVDANKCVELAPDWAKAFSRLGAAQLANGNHTDAVDAYSKGIALEPANAGMLKGLQQAQACVEAEDGGSVEQRAAAAESVKAAMGAQAAEAKVAAAAKAKLEADASSGISNCIGIDLGTTYSCVAVWMNNGVEIIANASGDRTTPSWVAFAGDERLVGQAAVHQAASNPANTVFDAKRIIGQHIKDEAVQKDIKHFPFAVKEGEGGKPMVEVEYRGETKQYAAEEISAAVLGEMKATAEAHLGHEVTSAVVTVPAYFNDQQRQATKDAGAIAGLDVKRIINEPTAAALAYGLDKQDAAAQNVLVFDLGGGTFDVSILKQDGGIFEVLATGGDTHLGGEDFDNNVVDHLAEDIKRKLRQDVKGNPRALRRLRTAVERGKRVLSSGSSTTIEIDSLIDGKDYSATLSRAKFEQLNADYFQKCMDTVQKVVEDSKLPVDQIADIVLVGGSTRIPKIQEMLTAHFGGKELCKSINPDEAVAYGAAVQGAVISGVRSTATDSLLLVDVTPLSLGIMTTGRVMSTIIKRNTPIPVRKVKQFTTEKDWQVRDDVEIYEGERASVDANNKLGEFEITGIQKAKRGEPQIEVTFAIDVNGILKVTAKDKKTGSTAGTTITDNRGRLTQEEIDKMVADGEAFRKEDKKRVQCIEARNELEHTIYDIKAKRGYKDAPESSMKIMTDTEAWMEANPEANMVLLNGKTEEIKRAFYHR
jgi:heat shock 70kDa protein 1/2/6/8